MQPRPLRPGLAAEVSIPMRICCVLACDAGFFHQARACIDTLTHCIAKIAGPAVDIAFVAIGLTTKQRDWLEARQVFVFEGLRELPRFAGAPDHSYALTCRPYLPRIFPGYDGYVWIDCDIRFLLPSGLAIYLQCLTDPQASVAIAQETEGTYCVNADPRLAYNYHTARVTRLLEVYDPTLVEQCRYYTPFNSGVFAARRDLPIWELFRRNLHLSLAARYDRMREQDALNIAILELGRAIPVPSVCNWLCSLALPIRRADGTWRHPREEDRVISVAHLTNSSDVVETDAGPSRFYDLYKRMGLTV